MRFHLFGLATVPTHSEFTRSPFTILTLDMARMLMAHGHEVIHYGAAGSNTPCTESVELVSSETLARAFHGGIISPHTIHWHNHKEDAAWREFTERGKVELEQRYRTGDIALMSFGNFHDFVPPIATLHCEFCCGYTGIFSGYRVFPSYAWMHYLYGEMKIQENGNWWDTVVPHYLNPGDFEFREKKDSYVLFLARLFEGKGPDIAIDIARRAGIKILLAGTDPTGQPHLIPEWLKCRAEKGAVEFLGSVDRATRRELLAGAKALLTPCRYIEAFGMNAIEALASGTPVISSDWGAFTETVENGVTGFRCRDMSEFSTAMKNIDKIDPAKCRATAEAKYSFDAAYPQYERYFRRLTKQLGEGWYGIGDGWRGTSIGTMLRDMGDVGNQQIVEVGVGDGRLSEHLLAEHPSANLVMVDNWKVAPAGSEYRRSGDAAALRSLREVLADRAMAVHRTDFAAGRRDILCGESLAAARAVKPDSVDLAFIDADHTFRAVCADIDAWWPKVRPGGFLAGHDFGNPTPGCSGVKDAVLQFSHRVGLPIRHEADWVWAIQRPVLEGPTGPVGSQNESGITATELKGEPCDSV